jgi:hypothetical protein
MRATHTSRPSNAPIREPKDWETFRSEFLRLVDIKYFVGVCHTLALMPFEAGKSILTAADLFPLYVRLVKNNHVSPSREFDEAFYIAKYPDVAAAVRLGEYISGFHHWVLHGRREGRSTTSLLIYEAVSSLFSLEFYRLTQTPPLNCQFNRSGAIAHFLQHGFYKGIVPVPPNQFDEDFYLLYYSDIRIAKATGKVPSGYAHYVLTGREEGRFPVYDAAQALQAKLGLLSYPIGVTRTDALRNRLDQIRVQVARRRNPVLNVFIPSLDPDMIFGGYIAFFHFLSRWSERGQRLRFVIMEDGQSCKEWFLKGISHRQRWVNAFREAEYVNLGSKQDVLMCNGNDTCIAYSCWTAHDAWGVARYLYNKVFYYFIQEFGPIFHEHDSLNFFANAAYVLPHIAVFNSSILRDYFDNGRIGVFSSGNTRLHTYFEHALANVTPNLNSITSRGGRGGRKGLLWYARPERHAGRNLFEVCVLALSAAMKDGIIDSTWDLVGIGSLGHEYEIEIGGGQTLVVRSRVAQDEYEPMLQSFDVGLSLMWAPHPSVIPFEMAKAGVVAVTNTFGSRTHKVLSGFGHNIVSCDPSIVGIVAGICEASRRSCDYNARVLGAALKLPTDWDAVFTDAFYSALLSLRAAARTGATGVRGESDAIGKVQVRRGCRSKMGTCHSLERKLIVESMGRRGAVTTPEDATEASARASDLDRRQLVESPSAQTHSDGAPPSPSRFGFES